MEDMTGKSLVETLGSSINRIGQENQKSRIVTDGTEWGREAGFSPSGEVDLKFVQLFEPELHGFTEICICVDGCFAMMMEQRIVELGQGDVCLLLPGVFHNELPLKDDNYSAIWLSIDFNRANIHLSGKGCDTPFAIQEGRLFKPGYELIRSVDEIKMELEQRNAFYLEAVKSALLSLLISVYRELAGSGRSMPDGGNWKGSIVLEVQRYIKDHYAGPIRLNDISQTVCISPNYLNTIFKAVAGTTIVQYHEDYRMEMAKGMLRNSRDSINRISTELGYYDQYHFSRMFKKHSGISPLQYRKQESENSLR